MSEIFGHSRSFQDRREYFNSKREIWNEIDRWAEASVCSSLWERTLSAILMDTELCRGTLGKQILTKCIRITWLYIKSV